MKKHILIMIVFSLLLLIACKNEYEPFKSNTSDISGEWWIQYFEENEDDSLELLYSYEFIQEYLGSLDEPPRIGSMAISNTSNNDKDSVLIEDNFWPFKIKSKYSDLKFGVSSYNSLQNDVVINLISGKILKGAATSPSGRKTDSIYLKLEFSDDEGVEYVISGYRNTGWPEDRKDLQ
jgi:hypothetical protein